MFIIVASTHLLLLLLASISVAQNEELMTLTTRQQLRRIAVLRLYRSLLERNNNNGHLNNTIDDVDDLMEKSDDNDNGNIPPIPILATTLAPLFPTLITPTQLPDVSAMSSSELQQSLAKMCQPPLCAPIVTSTPLPQSSAYFFNATSNRYEFYMTNFQQPGGFVIPTAVSPSSHQREVNNLESTSGSDALQFADSTPSDGSSSSPLPSLAKARKSKLHMRKLFSPSRKQQQQHREQKLASVVGPFKMEPDLGQETKDDAPTLIGPFVETIVGKEAMEALALTTPPPTSNETPNARNLSALQRRRTRALLRRRRRLTNNRDVASPPSSGGLVGVFPALAVAAAARHQVV